MVDLEGTVGPDLVLEEWWCNPTDADCVEFGHIKWN